MQKMLLASAVVVLLVAIGDVIRPACDAIHPIFGAILSVLASAIIHRMGQDGVLKSPWNFTTVVSVRHIVTAMSAQSSWSASRLFQ